LSSQTFSLALVETLLKKPETEREGRTIWEKSNDEIRDDILAAVGTLPKEMRPVLTDTVNRADRTLEGFRQSIEGSFNEVMDRASGWYKRKTQFAIAVIAAALAIGLNIDSLRAATHLWKEAVRSAVASKAVAETSRTPTGDEENLTPTQRAAKDVEEVKALDLPLGWGGDNAPDNLWDGVRQIPGWLITIAALMLGAPFWFDVPSRFARLRGAGNPSDARDLSDRGKAGQAANR
jgi:hypothetical protein